MPDLDLKELKREILLFDKIAFTSLTDTYKQQGIDDFKSEINIFDFLSEKGLIFEIPRETGSSLKRSNKYQEYQHNIKLSAGQAFETILELLKHPDFINEFPRIKDDSQFIADMALLEGNFKEVLRNDGYVPTVEKTEFENLQEYIFQSLLISGDLMARAACIKLNNLNYPNAFSLLRSNKSFQFEPVKEKTQVIQVTLKSLPIPDETVSWEQIIDFKSDSDSRSKFLALRNWINEIARGELPFNDVEDKLEELLDQYLRHMQFHKMKYKKGKLEALVVTTFEVLGNLTGFNWGEIAKVPFSIQNKKLALMEEEMKAPGREVAYISKAREQFS